MNDKRVILKQTLTVLPYIPWTYELVDGDFLEDETILLD